MGFVVVMTARYQTRAYPEAGKGICSHKLIINIQAYSALGATNIIVVDTGWEKYSL